MELLVGIGNSTQVDGYTAGLEAAGKVKKQLGNKLPNFIFVFTTIGYEHEDVLEAITEIFGDIPMSGSTFEGIIGGEIQSQTMISPYLRYGETSTGSHKEYSPCIQQWNNFVVTKPHFNY